MDIRSILEYHGAFTASGLDKIEALVTLKKFSKDELLHSSGKASKEMFFIKSGVIRTFFYDESGTDATIWFYQPGDIVTHWESFFTGSPCEDSIQATEDTEVYVLSRKDYYAYVKEDHSFALLMLRLLEVQCAGIERWAKEQMNKSAQEKYEMLQANLPSIVHKLKLGHVASFLGINQSTLSRLRK